ncbi:HYR domain-containing protein [Rasiella rasia]|uniref:receptor protein-tyrosine kinase n=1 Tax=Rasiella rasia TaxID=2744027 RepID=A0A6G6GI70_9FLAO|nr:HYR domain-containing protein [Rasiella rasia]QIE58286.1 HYR domain-containing protein [Rasiella rasia]
MKKITLLCIALCSLFLVTNSFAQKVVIVGMNHISGGAGDDGFTFVATENIPGGEVIYFTENEYVSGSNAFTFGTGTTGEGVIRYVVGAGGLATGVVVFINEDLGSNAFTITCSSGDCGSLTASTTNGNGSFNLATNGDGLYAYSDTDENVLNGITQIYSVMYTGSGESLLQNGGAIPASESPAIDYPNAVIVDGFPNDSDDFVGPDRVEYVFNPATLRDGVSQASLENPTNYVSYVSQQLLSTVPFTNLNLGGANPVLTVTTAPTSVNENSGTGMVYTFTLSAAAVGPVTANFSVGGTATFSTDYNQSGAASFNASTGTVTIPNGATTASVTITPVGDGTLEPDETVVLTITSGTGYDAGAPSIGTGTIINDDSISVTPLVAVTGSTHSPPITPESFSFVALDDIGAGVQVYFTERDFNNNQLNFSGGGGGVAVWTAPAGGIVRGEVVVVAETGSNVFTTSCNSGTCGSVSIISGTWDLASQGASIFAYRDSDTNPENGITSVDAVLFTGTSSASGGNIPAIEDPSGVYAGSVVVDGFPSAPSERTEYDPTLRGVTVDQANFQNIANWLHSQPTGALSPVPFANIIITTGSANPALSVTVAPSTTVEDSGTSMVYTFLLDAPAAADTTVNFDVSGTATLTTDYTVSGAATFSATAGTALITTGNTSVDVTITPVVDAIVEPTETIELMVASGTGYDGGTPNAATGSITNDDTSMSDPLVAVMGMTHELGSMDSFSFAAAQDVPAGTVVYFTEESFNNTTLMFASTGEGVVQWTAPAGGQIDQGDVIVITETASNVFTATCSDTSGFGCGTAVLVSGTFALASNGETFYAYEDSDTDPTNGVDDIYSVMYTGVSATPGGNIPPSEDPSGIYLSALVVDGFAAVAPRKTEYTPGSRNVLVGMADFENPSNYDNGVAPGAGLSTVPFANLNIVVTFTAPADLCVDAGVQAGLGGGSPTGGVYSGPGVTDDGNGMTYSFDPAAAGVGVHTLSYTSGGTAVTDDIEVFALPTVTFTAPADLCVDAGVQAGLGGGTPTGGVYSGTGVTDDGNGTTYSFDPAAAGVGTHTITYNFTDGNGCSGSASDDVEVFALPTVTFTAPADLCVDDGVQTGLGGGTPTGGVYSGPGVTDDGNGTTYSFDPAAAGVGTHTLTYTFTDANGCTGSATDDIEVFESPTIFSAGTGTTITLSANNCNAGGEYTLEATLFNGRPSYLRASPFNAFIRWDGTQWGVFDDFGNVAMINTINTPTPPCSDLSPWQASLCSPSTVTGDGTTCDDFSPSDVCINSGIQTGLGNVNPTGGVYSGTGVTDDGNGMTYSFDPAAAGVGTHTITYTVTNGNGCTATASSDVEVFALPTVTFTAPADLCVDAGVQAGLGGGTPTGGVYSGPGVTDDGNGMTYSFDPAAAGVGTHTITYTFTDGNGCTASATDDVEVFALPTVTFTAPASPVCPTLVLTGQGGGTPIGGVYSGPGVTDDGNGMTYTFDTNASGTGTHTITYTYTDGNGCTASDSDTVTVEDNDPPAITCPADITVDNDPGECGAIVTFAATATDNCPSTVSITYSQDPGTQFPVGTTTVTATATDGAGNSATCTFNVTVNDAEDPTITCPGDITVNNDPGNCGTVVTYTSPMATDNCSGFITTETFDFTGAMQTFTVPSGVTSISIEAFGGAGQDMIIEDFDPSIGGLGGQASGDLAVTPGDVLTIFVGGEGVDGIGGFNGGGVGGFGTPSTGTGGFAGSGGGASDVRLGGMTLADRVIVAGGGGGGGRDYVNGSCVPCGIGGNGGSGGGFTGTDGEDPSWSGILGAFPNAGAGGKGGTPAMGGAAGNGPNGPPGNPGTLGIGGIGVDGTQSVASGGGGGGFYGGGSGGGGNSGDGFAGAGGAGGSSYVGGVTSGMTNAGVRTGNGQIIITYAALSVTQTAGLPSGSTFPVGTTTNTFVVTDGAGNTATCSFDVTVNDTENPVITCPANITVNNDPGACGAIVSFAATATDNCSAAVTYSQDPGTSFPVGTTTVTATATDPSGNTATCTFDVTVVDNEPPVAVCTDITVQLDATGNASITPGDIDGGSTDNCGIAALGISPSTFTCADVGANTVTLTVTDVNGNSSTCTATVTVEDNVAPTAVCQDITIQLDANGDASIVAADVDGGSTDACGIASIAVDIDTFDCSNVGPNNVTLTVTDVNGNTSSCVAVVTVEDNIAPMIFCPADIVAPTNNGECGATVTFPLPVGTDNCGIDFVVQQAGIASGEIFPIGVTTNQFIVVDVNGNTATCSFTVTVTDDDPPMAVCQDITVMLDATGNATIVAADVDGGSTDNCAITSLSIDIDSFTCADLGDNIVTLTATDAGGLSSSCTAIVTVENGVMPNAVCQDASVQLDALGMVSIIDASIFDGGSTDACGGTNLTFSVSPDTFTCADVGDNTVTITVTDDGGNTSTCTATLTVEDVIAPTVSCMDLTVSLDANGEASIDPADLVVMSDDICGIAQTSADITDFNCDDVGTPIVVTVTVEDPSGNTATCTATVTVLDEIAPELDCPVDFTVQTIEGTQYEVENFITSGAVTATDNCTDPVNVVSQSPAVGDLLDPGVYPVTITVSDASGNEADCTFNLTVEAVLGIGDNSFDISSVSMYPNPATDFVMLSNPQHIPLQDVRIYDVTGRLIKTIDARETLSEMSIDISELASATYLFLVNTENGEQLTHQIVKE